MKIKYVDYCGLFGRKKIFRADSPVIQGWFEARNTSRNKDVNGIELKHQYMALIGKDMQR